MQEQEIQLEENKEHCATHNYQNCMYDCPELKSNMLEPKDRRRLLNFIKEGQVMLLCTKLI